jgi:hypothetical protein
LNNNINSLYSIDAAGAMIQTSNQNQYKKIITVDLNREPGDIGSLGPVSSFKALNNWFFDSLLSPIISTFGEKYAKDKKNPTHVDVHNIHLINEDTNEKNGVNTFNPCPGCAFLCIRFLNPLKIDP